jgi:hypothetical protein
LEETARHHCWLAMHRQGDMGHLQHLENNKISIQIYKVVQHLTGQTWKKLLIIIVGWQRIGKVICGTCNVQKTTTRLVNKSTK